LNARTLHLGIMDIGVVGGIGMNQILLEAHCGGILKARQQGYQKDAP
jgi:hypothetical protein